MTLRTHIETDKNFIFATMLRGLFFGNDLYSCIDKKIFYETYEKVLHVILGRPNVEVIICCLQEDPNVIIGYAIIENSNILHWVFVKAAWRKIGIARTMIPSTVSVTTHLTETGKSIIKRHPGIIFNPFII